MNIMANILSVKNGDSVSYEAVGSSEIHHSTVVGSGQKNGERILYLANGHWCYLTDVTTILVAMPKSLGKH